MTVGEKTPPPVQATFEDALAKLPEGYVDGHFGNRTWGVTVKRSENSHQPTRRRERIMKRFKSRRQLQRFLSIHDPIANLFHIPRHDISASHHRELRAAAMSMWAEIARI